ncbi:hypothetical protein [Sinorhizobium mexicanum]|uniref:Uncharacterized protein n=1 Tax=Sinorhizobium mexicanum TaxID=375549 RepID=A0A859QWI3_9HYPH|nr:hypothetical protein [Sinorhizobium mexicanum]MBP1884087.1 hypothetical protein [Sinorhizobium mexicanum]QLL64806.1 hypothetical protein FKV68_25745 [Sinorhizobium mexicanum]
MAKKAARPSNERPATGCGKAGIAESLDQASSLTDPPAAALLDELGKLCGSAKERCARLS